MIDLTSAKLFLLRMVHDSRTIEKMSNVDVADTAEWWMSLARIRKQETRPRPLTRQDQYAPDNMAECKKERETGNLTANECRTRESQ